MNIVHLLGEWVSSAGERTALIDHHQGVCRRVSFTDMERGASRIAAQLFEHGLRPGDAVLLLHPVSAELYMIFSALLRSGLVAVFIDPAEGRGHIERSCEIHPPRALVACARAHLLRLVCPALRRIPLKFTTDHPVWAARRLHWSGLPVERTVIEDCTEDAPAIIRFTSGSTGKPKAAMRTHGFLMAQQRVLARSFRLAAGEIDMVTMPMFVLSNLAAGVTSLIPRVNLRAPESIQPGTLLREIHLHKPQRICAAPALLERLADYCATTGHSLSGVEKIFTGGAPVFPRLLDKLRAAAPGAVITGVYGSTEAEPIAQLHHHEFSAADRALTTGGKGLLAGYPDADIQLRILREEETASADRALSAKEFESAVLPPGGAGQIAVAGPHVQPGYLDERDTRLTKITVDGVLWHLTGDAGYLDEEGRLWLLGRSGARITDGQGTVYPFQVEGAAMENPEVRRAALLSHGGRRVLAVESGGRLDANKLCRELAWAGIQSVHLLPRLPVDRRHHSKIDYQALSALLQ